MKPTDPTKPTKKERAVTILIVAIFLLLWQIGSDRGTLKPFFFSSPRAIILDFFKLIGDGDIFYHLYITLTETLGGFFLGVFFGTVCAWLLSKSRFWMHVLDPIIMMIYSIPRIALAPLFILWFGIGVASKIVFSFSLVFFIIFYNVLGGIRSIDKSVINALRVMGASPRQIFFKVKLPYISPWIFSGLKSSVGMSLLGSIIGEYQGGSAGIGWMINYASNLFQTTRVFSSLLALCVMVFALNKILTLIERFFARFDPNAHRV